MTAVKIIVSAFGPTGDAALTSAVNSSAASAAAAAASAESVGPVFETVAEMVASTNLTVGQHARTLGYTTLGDGGGNDYDIVAAGTGVVDGGVFINLSAHQANGLFDNIIPRAIHFGGNITNARAYAVGTDYSGLISSQRFREFDDEFVQIFGGIGIQDTVDTTKKRSTFRLDRKVTDLATADFTDPETGSFSQPQMLELSYQVDGETGVDGSGVRGVRMLTTVLTNNSNQPAQTSNFQIRNGGISPKATWSGLVEMYDTSSSSLSTLGDPDQDLTADVNGVTGNTMIGLEINGKMKANTTFVGLQILPRTYGRVVTDVGRPKADRCIFLGPSRNGSDFVGGSYLDDATGANILRQIDMSSGPADASNAARSDYGIWSRMPFEEAFIAMPLTDKIVFDNDAGTPNQVQMFGASAGVLAVSADGGTNNILEVRAAKLTVANNIELDTQSSGVQNRPIDWSTAGSKRWRFRADNAAESGSDVGSAFRISSFADDGTTETLLILMDRDNDRVDFKTQVRMSGLPTSAAGLGTGDLWNNSGVINIA